MVPNPLRYVSIIMMIICDHDDRTKQKSIPSVYVAAVQLTHSLTILLLLLLLLFLPSQHHHHLSIKIKYSGGQPSVGQGGFYGSGGARALTPDSSSTTDNDDDASQQKQNQERNKMLAMAHDVQTVRLVMQELDLLESLLRNEEESKSTTGSSGSPSSSLDAVSPKSMEIKNSMKKLMTSTDFLESLNNLEVQGEPAWGLSCEEREMIVLAREKVNAC